MAPHRTQLYLDHTDYQYVKNLAQKEQKSIAQVFRDWIQEKKNKRKNKQFKNDPFFKARGIFQSGDPEFANKIDDFLYGKDPK